MKLRRILLLMILFVLIGNTGCHKFLEEKPNSRVTVPESLDDLQALLDRSENMNEKNPVYGEASADDYFLTPDNHARLTLLGQEAYIWETKPYLFVNDWARCYNTVNIANICLDQLLNIERTVQNATAWDNVKGSALFYRAYNFLNLLWMHANAYDEVSSKQDMGIVLRLNANFNERSIRANVEESYNRVIADLKVAIDLLPDHPNHVMRPSKPAAFALLARTYLSMRKYENALDYANKSLSIKNSLMNYNDIDIKLLRPFESYNPEVIFHSSVSSFFVSNTQTTYANVDTVLYSFYDEGDLRKKLFFNTSGKYQTFKGNYMNGIFSHWMFTGITTSEMYLIRAECKVRLNNIPSALDDLNTLLRNRIIATSFFPIQTLGDNDEALQFILKERRKELVFRGLRWIDIKRFNKEGAGIKITRHVNGKEFILLPNDKRYALQLPTDIVDITGIPQNPL